MKKLNIYAFGSLLDWVLSAAQESLTVAFEDYGLKVSIMDNTILVPPYSFDPVREQFKAWEFLEVLRSYRAQDTFVFGITSEDIFVEGLNFVFGLSSPTMGVALISTKRLSPEFYNLDYDDETCKRIFLERIKKESIHEVGHIFGLGHCSQKVVLKRCVMSFSNSILDVDRKAAKLCRSCASRLRI